MQEYPVTILSPPIEGGDAQRAEGAAEEVFYA